MSTGTSLHSAEPARTGRLPLSALPALTTAVFVTSLTETAVTVLATANPVSWSVPALLLPVLAVVTGARAHGFPVRRSAS
ncbi:hypothetical protein AB0I77_37500 [Streptomyces sp. NPDC050619]|uniref:hypothetical protein n=1 Tax=Streptomyces sp. NPDC050619 TaxID=3157214 RepID=UPI0034289689